MELNFSEEARHEYDEPVGGGGQRMSTQPPTGRSSRAMGPPIKGPTAFGSDPRRLLRLTWTLAVTDFKLRFFGSALGYLWQIMKPLMLFGVLYLVFSLLLKFQGPEKFFAQSMLLAIVLFTFLGDTTAGAIQSVATREGLVRKIEFPRLAIPLAQVLVGPVQPRA